MKHFKKAIAIAATGAAMALASAPANAALTISFPVGASSGFFGDSSLAQGTSYDQSVPFILTGSGTGTFSLSSTSSLFHITAAYIDATAFDPTTTIGAFDFSGLVEGLAAGPHTLRVTGVVTATAPGSTGSFGGQINFIPSAVPEPATWAMMIGGVGFTGGALRRRAKRDAGKLALA